MEREKKSILPPFCILPVSRNLHISTSATRASLPSPQLPRPLVSLPPPAPQQLAFLSYPVPSSGAGPSDFVQCVAPVLPPQSRPLIFPQGQALLSIPRRRQARRNSPSLTTTTPFSTHSPWKEKQLFSPGKSPSLHPPTCANGFAGDNVGSDDNKRLHPVASGSD